MTLLRLLGGAAAVAVLLLLWDTSERKLSKGVLPLRPLVLGAEAILIPRATEEKTYQRWKIVFRANALTSAAYVLSVNRPDPEAGVLIGGPSVAIDPSGTPLVETTDRMALVTLEREEVGRARVAYPGYLPIRADLYGAAWDEIATRRG